MSIIRASVIYCITVIVSAVLILILPISSATATDIYAASASYADVNTAYGTANDGDRVIIPAGSATWNSTLTITKAITLLGPGSNSLTISYGVSPLVKIAPTTDKKIRVSGIYFDMVFNPGSDRTAISIVGITAGLTQIRIDHCKFNKGQRTVHCQGFCYGVIDHNTFINGDTAVGFTGDDDAAWSRPIVAGTANAMFIEDNNFIMDNNADRMPTGEQIYHQQGARSFTRYNTFDATAQTNWSNLFLDSHGDWPYYTNSGYHYRGQPIIEFYNNTLKAYNTYRWLHIRGGSSLIYNNTFTHVSGGVGSLIQLGDEESWQTILFSPLRSVWPAEDQIMNTFIWNNTIDGSAITSVDLEDTRDAPFIQQDRDYFVHAPQSTGGKGSYTGRAGGSTAAPTQSDTGNETFSSSGANAYYPYTPYPYPHPLVTGTSPPSAPKNLRIQ